MLDIRIHKKFELHMPFSSIISVSVVGLYYYLVVHF